ncbi:MAG: hypothetical protein LBP74_09945 [Treponema sp.]|nr:hypothetical protein [Treponema sp.]
MDNDEEFNDYTLHYPNEEVRASLGDIEAAPQALREYALDYPNEEVRGSFAEALLDHYVRKSATGLKPQTLAVPRGMLRVPLRL